MNFFDYFHIDLLNVLLDFLTLKSLYNGRLICKKLFKLIDFHMEYKCPNFIFYTKKNLHFLKWYKCYKNNINK